MRVHAGERKVSKKREAKDTKFGFGGRKRLGKQNDASSAADMGGFRQGNFDDGVGRGRCAPLFAPFSSLSQGSEKEICRHQGRASARR